MMKNSFGSKQQWVSYVRTISNSERRLFCFPYAGGSSIIFRRWPEILPETVEVCGIEIPGRGRRLNEPFIEDINLLVDKLSEALLPLLDKPFDFFGHSMGALVAFELSRSIKKKYGLIPGCLYVSAHAAPHVCQREDPMYCLPKAKFIERLEQLNGIPVEVLKNEELMEIMLPILRADFTVCETYNYEDGNILDCPIIAFGGLNDRNVTSNQLRSWGDLTKSGFDLYLVPGDHFFISKYETEFLMLLTEIMVNSGWKTN